MATAAEALRRVELEAGQNEASDLLPVRDGDLLAAGGWDWALWTVLDDQPVEKGIVVCGHRAGSAATDGWQALAVPCRPLDKKGRTDDAEACAAYGEHVYVFGSHYGSKDGPLKRDRQFVARFREADARAALDEEGKLELDVRRNKFRLHRLLNDALREFGPELLELDDKVRHKVVGKALRKASKKGKRWARRIHDDDTPLNIEGAAFRDDGTLLLGFRYPVTREGQPLVAELRGIDRLFGDEAGEPQVSGFWVLEAGASAQAPDGIRALRLIDGRLHAISGSLDSLDKGSILVDRHPEAAESHCVHLAGPLPPMPGAAGPATHRLPVERLHEFEGLRRIEGLARAPDGAYWYVSDDEDTVRLLQLREPLTAETAPATEDSEPVDGYDGLSVADLSERLPGMTAEQLAAAAEYERRHRNRSTALRAIEAAERRVA